MRMRNITTILTVAATFVAAPWAAADAPPGPYFNGFETDTAGWFNFSGATITRVPSGSNGVAAASGNWYARLGQDPSPASCTFGGGTAPIYYGPYTNWGGYSPTFPLGGYSTGVDIYLDVPYATSHPDTRFDWSRTPPPSAATPRYRSPASPLVSRNTRITDLCNRSM